MRKIKVIELFGGIGSPHKALTNLGLDYEVVDMIEFDAKAVKSYNAIHGTNFVPQDVTTWNKDIKVDYLHASTPCQAFSVAGKGLGAEDRRGAILWEATIRIIKQTNPTFITLENVKGLLQEKHKELLEWYLNELHLLGYHTQYQVLNSKDYGVPQNRERVFFMSAKHGTHINEVKPACATAPAIKDILQPEAQWEEASQVVISEDKAYFKNKLSNYPGKTIEVDLTKLFNQTPGSINRVAKLKQPLFEDLNINDKLQDYGFSSIASFYGTNGVNGAITAQDGNRQKVMEVQDLESLAFNQAKNYHGINGVTGTLVASAITLHEQKILALASDVSFNSDKSFIGEEGVAPTLVTAHPDFKGKLLKHSDKSIMYRKLLPIETWLLMGFTKEDFYKAEKVNSPNQLVKQAGNSIVVNVIEAVLQANLHQFVLIDNGWLPE